MHQVGAYESSSFKQGLFFLRHLVQYSQQQESDQRDGDLNANSVFGAADKVGDFQGLLHHTEEQFDLPAPLVEFGNFLGGGVQIVGQNAQSPASLHGHDDLADRALHGIFAAFGLTPRQKADAVAQNSRSRLDGHGFDRMERRVFLEPRHDTAAGVVQRSPPAIIIIAEVENVGSASLDRHRLGRGDIVDVRLGDHVIDRTAQVGI